MAVSCHSGHWAALTERGGLLLYGEFQHGLLVPTALGGRGAHAGEAIDTLVGGLEALAISANELVLPAPGEGGAPPPPPPPPPFGGERLVMVSENGCTACVTDSGAVWVWGRNAFGQLGLGDTVRRAQPVQWPPGACGGAVVLMVACGIRHTTALTQTGTVWSCGAVFGGSQAPTQVPGLARVCMIAEGYPHGMALDADGQVWIWGDHWPLAHNAPPPETVPPPRNLGLAAFAGEKAVFVAAGWHYAAVVTAQGELWTWGRGLCGNLGHGDHERRALPTLVGAGQASPWAGSRVRTVSCGDDNTLVLTADGGVWHCGRRYSTADDNTAQDGVWELVPTRIAQSRFGDARIVHVAVGGSIFAAVTAEGILYVWGTGALRGEDGLHMILRVPTPVAASLAPGSRAGRGCGLPRRNITAFCMGTIPRLGGGSAEPGGRARSVVYDANENVLQVIVQQAAALTGLYRHMGEGQLRLLAVRERVC